MPFIRKIAVVPAILFAAFAMAGTSGACAQTAAILVPGAGGPGPYDFLIRNRNRFSSAGIETFVATSAQEAASLVQSLKSQRRKAVIVGMSRGGIATARALASGAPASGVVFVSSNFRAVRRQLGSQGNLPPALIVHHRRDGCRPTTPSNVASFAAWARGKVRVAWFDNSGQEARNPCGPRGAHGFFMNDSGPVSAIIGFVRSR
jgi:pimeloyl-ACP methyl ester carboxylesterase